MSDPADPSQTVPSGGAVRGFAFGAVAQRSNFCTMGALSDVVNMDHRGRARMCLPATALGGDGMLRSVLGQAERDD